MLDDATASPDGMLVSVEPVSETVNAGSEQDALGPPTATANYPAPNAAYSITNGPWLANSANSRTRFRKPSASSSLSAP